MRKVAQRVIKGEEKQIEVLYPSMYFGIEKQRTTDGTPIPNTTYAVNNIYLNGVADAFLRILCGIGTDGQCLFAPPVERPVERRHSNIMFSTSWMAQVAAIKPNGQARFYLTDQVDSVKVVVDDSGLAVRRREYLRRDTPTMSSKRD